MPSFSERYGYKSAKETIQLEEMDNALLHSLWTIFYEWVYEGNFRGGRYLTENDNFYWSLRSLWLDFYKLPVDRMPKVPIKAIKELKDRFYKAKWYEVYDFIEFTANSLRAENRKSLILLCNKALKTEVSGHRFVGSRITRITSDTEITEIDEAMQSNKYRSATTHLGRALELLSDRKNPDYRNSIKESISAVEAICSNVLEDEKATLGKALKKLNQSVNTHPALNSAFNSLYGYTSDAERIRHALLEEEQLDFEDAKFMLVACSAFVNYLREKARKAELEL